ncbi:Sm-like protein LSM1B [Tanacetum coccineum]
MNKTLQTFQYYMNIKLISKRNFYIARDVGSFLWGYFRSFDQFENGTLDIAANAVLEGACERVIVGDLYCDISLGLYVIRGENVVLIGELDLEKEELPPHMTRVSETEIKSAQKVRKGSNGYSKDLAKEWNFLDMD